MAYEDPMKMKEVSGVGTVEVRPTCGGSMLGIYENGRLVQQSADAGYIMGQYNSMGGTEYK